MQDKQSVRQETVRELRVGWFTDFSQEIEAADTDWPDLPFLDEEGGEDWVGGRSG